MMNVKNNKFALLLAASAVSLALTGCGGDDGTDGNPGDPGGPAADVVNVLNLDVTKVTYQDGMPTIEVFATNEEDIPVVGLQDLGVTAAQLTPMGATGAGNSAQWTRTARVSGTDSYIDNKNGSYTFTLELSEYNADMTQRFNVTAGGKDSTLADGTTSVPRREIVKDFSGEGYQALYTKNIVSHETCTSCHAEGEPITRRHSSYYTQETCATCHSSSMSEEKQWNHLIHNIHNTAKTFEDKKGNEYTGEAAEALIQNNCKSCHVEPDADSGELTEWGNWTRVPTMETCTSCHVDIDFKAGKGHSQQNDNSNCIACHNASWTEEIHTDGFVEKKALIDQYAMEATLTAVATDSGSDTTLSITITGADGAAIDAATLLTNIEQLESITNVGPNFPIMGYNPSPGNGEHKVLINLVKNGTLDENASIVDGKFVTTISNLPYGEVGADTDTAFSFIGLALCNDGTDLVACGEGVDSTSMKAELAHGTLSGEAPSVRHTDSVNFAACESCHGTEWELHQEYHAGFVMTEQLGRINEAGEMIVGVDGCVACHTPDGTYMSGGNKGALEMKLHSLHSGGDYGIIKGLQCSQCHNDFNLDAFKVKGALATSSGKYSTPIAATCGSCHSHSDSFKPHAEGQGAIIDGSYEAANDAAQLETCFLCHNPNINDHTSVKM
ncbi:OmcA/MtrC family decaheme c-type cytochrome [Shewanella benthica]|uniref:OmcA/MtrC family decaheme c-type cytochrome n=1 Tax=Shewanella benthica TaxID=43661 RepID=UPI00187A6CF8|nr:OmcA/MtrC family decaheme c-type cytochrome [Shewanella benthica]MBE7214350.1 OmcA/MtrC family decaheme c-type cytochrome [Shewanella benthica]MBL4816823.1 OmcA/MtrC family decaheme c-type cytochrome [Shewanella sp.]MCL1064131.1 OmcA/MtrC family decaheme c-type cytochrome [Shewanella benthica]